MSNIVDAYPREGVVFRTKPLFQWDWGQIVRLHISDLPATYKVEFSNSTRADAVSTVQTTDEVTVPAQFLESGNPVYAWIVVVDEARTTEYSLIIPVSARAKPTDLEPSPEEKTEIEQTLSALNEAVSDVQEIADAIPDTINDALEAAKESGEFDGADGKDGQDGKDGADGFSPTAAVNKVGSTSTITITDKNGTTTATVLDGKDGAPGADGQTGPAGKDGKDGVDGSPGAPGADGTTFTPSVSAEGVISWTNDGGKTNPQPMSIKGPQGDDGTSPTVSVADITGGHRVTVTDANGTRSFDVMDGDDYTLTAADKAEIAQQAAEDVDVPVTDVQVNGTSILSQGVANIPQGSSSERGVFLLATTTDIKSGSSTARVITPCGQNTSVFYGLAKVAGDTTQSASSNAVGVYTADALVKIQKMLGIYETPWELIREDTVTHETSELLDIAVDGNGQAFELTDIRLLIQVPTQETDFVISNYATVAAYYGTTDRIGFVGIGNSTYTIAANSASYAMLLEIGWEKGMSKMEGMQLQKETGRTNMQTGLYFNPTSTNREFLIGDNTFSKIRIPGYSGTLKYRLYGKRKWN